MLADETRSAGYVSLAGIGGLRRLIEGLAGGLRKEHDEGAESTINLRRQSLERAEIGRISRAAFTNHS